MLYIALKLAGNQHDEDDEGEGDEDEDDEGEGDEDEDDEDDEKRNNCE